MHVVIGSNAQFNSDFFVVVQQVLFNFCCALFLTANDPCYRNATVNESIKEVRKKSHNKHKNGNLSPNLPFSSSLTFQ